MVMGGKGSKGGDCTKNGSKKVLPRRISKKVSSKDALDLDLYFMSRHEAEEILGDSPQRSGTFLIYEDADSRRTFLAFKSAQENVSHHPITYHRDLYYLDSYPFPYLESIILYYRKHKLDTTRLTDQAFIEPYLMASRRIGRSPRPSHRSVLNSDSPEIPRTQSFIAKYGIYRRYNAGNIAHEQRESEHVI